MTTPTARDTQKGFDAIKAVADEFGEDVINEDPDDMKKASYIIGQALAAERASLPESVRVALMVCISDTCPKHRNERKALADLDRWLEGGGG